MNYILFGSEDFLIRQRINKLIKSFFNNEEGNIVHLDYLDDGIDEFIFSLEQMDLGFFNKKVIILDNADFLSVDKERKKIDNYRLNKLLKNLEANDEDLLIIFVTHKDTLLKRSEVVKLLDKIGKIYSFPLIKKSDFLSYIKKYFEMNGYNIEENAINLIEENIKEDLYLFSNEATKLMLYCENKNITKKDVEEICSININDNIFELSNMILAKNYKKIFEIYNDLRVRNVEIVTLIAFLTTNFLFYDEILFLSNKGQNYDEIASLLNVNPYRVSISLRNLKKYTLNDINKILKELYEIDKNIKLGNIDRFFAFEMFLSSI